METLQIKFVEFIPELLDNGTLYISIDCRTAIHKCVCGCGNEVITPFSPTDWELRFYGDSVSLLPSIGNWSFPCRSHYWITNNKIRHAGNWTNKQVSDGRFTDRTIKNKYYKDITNRLEPQVQTVDELPLEVKNVSWIATFWGKLVSAIKSIKTTLKI
ncbi:MULTISPECIES: DUF6527 family protein [Mucilaginibacter]|uniref:Uncharacterized protein n=1 Tax=Mucilaginibacter defluvii TaxID=1196019 RepID=A0ABP9FP90_9SPHI|nr:DUF6527 family protein [Mucilaginibacter sp.]